MKNYLNIFVVGSFAAIIGYAVFSKKNKTIAPTDLPPELNTIFQQLLEKGYKPETSPKDRTKPFITFAGFEKEKIVINSKGLTIVYKDGKASKPITYADGLFLQDGKIIYDDPNFVDGLINILENKDYE